MKSDLILFSITFMTFFQLIKWMRWRVYHIRQANVYIRVIAMYLLDNMSISMWCVPRISPQNLHLHACYRFFEDTVVCSDASIFRLSSIACHYRYRGNSGLKNIETFHVLWINCIIMHASSTYTLIRLVQYIPNILL